MKVDAKKKTKLIPEEFLMINIQMKNISK